VGEFHAQKKDVFSMIRLIACDMDGTLLDSNKQLPSELPELLQILKQRGVTFAVASGRSMVALTHLFGDLADDMIFLCDNGACVQMPHQEPVVQCMPFDIVHHVLHLCAEQEAVTPVLCCVGGIYYPARAKAQFQKEINNFYVNFTTCSDAEMFRITDPVLKIALCDMENPATHMYPILQPRIGDRYELAVSGAVWMDIMCKGVHKGAAIRTLQEKLGISAEETMVFGDYGNDLSMMQEAYYSCAMANGTEEVRKAARFVVPSNDENGVVRTICEQLQISLEHK
jgi:hypothetical protein